MWLPRMSMSTLHLGWTLVGVEWAIFMRYFGENIQPKSVENGWGYHLEKNVVDICWRVSKGYQSCLATFLDSRKQQYGFDLQQMAMDERCVPIRPAKPEWLVGSKAQPVLQLYIRLGVWLHPCQYYRPSSDMPAVRHEFLSIYQMAWVKSGKDEQGRRLLVTTMLHPSMKILVPHRIHRCERWRTAVWGSTGRVVPPKAGLSHPGMPRQAASCRGAVEAQNWANLVSGWPWLP